MSDLINRRDAIDALEEQLDYLQMLNKEDNPTAESNWYGVNWARNTIADLPSAELEIIRCKDCTHRFVDGENVLYNCCELNHNNVQSDDWFCADAERKTDE